MASSDSFHTSSIVQHGLLWQDYQHVELMRTMRSLQKGILNRSLSKAQVDEAMGFLKWYVRHHFGGEEAYMEVYAYPEMAAHRAQHQKLEERLHHFADVVDDGFGNIDLHACAELCLELNNWYLQHISGPDKELAMFLASKGVK